MIGNLLLVIFKKYWCFCKNLIGLVICVFLFYVLKVVNNFYTENDSFSFIERCSRLIMKVQNFLIFLSFYLEYHNIIFSPNSLSNFQLDALFWHWSNDWEGWICPTIFARKLYATMVLGEKITIMVIFSPSIFSLL